MFGALAAAVPAAAADDALERRAGGSAPVDDLVCCAEVEAFCRALDGAAAVVADSARVRGLDDPETMTRIAELAALARIGDGYERDGAFVRCGDEVARTCGASVARAMASLADALRRAEEQRPAPERDDT
ncbi:MAG TPA: hypothetical protein VIS07_06875 [Candidatus Binatia bacterium]